MSIRAVIFDLDGVIVSTDEYHYQGWQRLADEEGIYFDREINQRLRGVSRMASLDILLEKSERRYTEEEKKALADRKNAYYRAQLAALVPEHILAGVMPRLRELKRRGVKIAVASSSRNARTIIERIGLAGFFDATVDGNDISRSKPDPEVFLLAAERVGVPPAQSLVVEDAAAGVEGALAGGMRVLGVGFAEDDERATLRAQDLAAISVDEMLAV